MVNGLKVVHYFDLCVSISHTHMYTHTRTSPRTLARISTHTNVTFTGLSVVLILLLKTGLSFNECFATKHYANAVPFVIDLSECLREILNQKHPQIKGWQRGLDEGQNKCYTK